MHSTVHHRHHEGVSEKNYSRRRERKQNGKMNNADLNSHDGNGRAYEVYAIGVIVSRRSN